MKTNRVLLGVLGLAVGLGWASRQTHMVQSEIVIDAPPERVWEVLSNTAAYPQWNPVIVRLEGSLQPGQTIEFENRVRNQTVTLRPTIQKAEAGRELRWLGKLGVPNLFDGEHFFVLHPTADGKTHLTHGEHFTGVFIPLARRWLNSEIKDGFHRMNAALKARAEAGV